MDSRTESLFSADTAPGSAPAPPARRLVPWRGYLARLLATAGAALFVYAAFAPWLIVTSSFYDGTRWESSEGALSGSTFVTGVLILLRGALLPHDSTRSLHSPGSR
ncbi:MAG: hypothetical protein IVW57_07220 [Ktedonobacterales bacterium]|nr:hypothetical protein [Ktedonobacterales bacterium]